MADDLNDLDKKYSEASFWEKLKNNFLNAGFTLIEKALVLYFTLGEPNVPAWAKTTITVALGYFIFPADTIPDITPAVGYSDDLAVISAALATVIASITPEARKKALETTEKLFGKQDAKPSKD